MQQPPSVQKGDAGESAVETFFKDLGWGPLSTGKQDLGTDLFVQVRDEKLVDLGMMLGVQVKTGDSWFGEEATVNGRDGWWFRESNTDHEIYWVNHHIPHVLIVQNQSRTQRVWARLDRKTIEVTGKGIRVFVPADQIVDEEAAGVWIGLVAEARKLQSFEGSRWNFDVTQVPETEWPRYALLASRIVAPHPNQGFTEDINWAEAVALCIQATPDRWIRFANERANVPTPIEAATHEDAGWRFAATIYALLTKSSDELEALDLSGFPKELQVAQAVCVSMIFGDRDEWLRAIDVLSSVRDLCEKSVDQAWIAVHLGHAFFEIGQLDEAKGQYEASVALHAAFPSSLTNSAIRSAGILALFEVARPFSGDVAAAVQASDTTLFWWQTQQVENALNNYLRRSYQRWAGDKSMTFGGGDPTHNELLSAGLSARLIGNWQSSRYADYLRAIAGLALPIGNDTKPEGQMELLRSAGYSKDLALALHHFRDEGPLATITAFMAGVTVARVKTTSIVADLESLQVAGTYLSDEASSEWIVYLLEVLEDPVPFLSRFNGRFLTGYEAAQALAGLRLQFTEEHERSMLRLILQLPVETTALYEAPLRRILEGLETTSIDDFVPELVVFAKTLPSDSWILRMVTDLLVERDDSARARVSERILNGELHTIPPGLRIELLTSEEAAAIVAACALRFDSYVGKLNEFSSGADAYQLAVQIALRGPAETSNDAWDLVARAISEANVIQERKKDAIEMLADNTNLLSESQREKLLAAITPFLSVQPSAFVGMVGFGMAPIGPSFNRLYLELAEDADDWQDTLGRLLTGGSLERRAAIRVLARRCGYDITLLALIRESDRSVALEAMEALARRAAEDSAIANLVVNELTNLMNSSGEQAALGIGSGIFAVNERVTEAAPLVIALIEHKSLAIRRLAHKLKDNTGTPPNRDC